MINPLGVMVVASPLIWGLAIWGSWGAAGVSPNGLSRPFQLWERAPISSELSTHLLRSS